MLGTLNNEQQKNLDLLQEQMDEALASAPQYPGDGNGDGVVDNLDVIDFNRIFRKWGKSSRYDFNYDGLTNDEDLKIIYDHWGACPQPGH